MTEEHLFQSITCDKYDLLSKSEVVSLHKEEENLRIKFQKEIELLKSQLNISDQKSFLLDEKYIAIKHKLFGKSSEKERSDKNAKTKDKGGKGGKRVQLPSKRYPNVPVVEQDVELETLPECPCCQSQMKDSGMTEDSEFVTVIPKKYMITRQKRHKYKCGNCYGGLVTAGAPKRIAPGSSYSDEMILDVGLSKYCDLIPLERYVAMAGRQGLMDLPPQSLIGLTHHLANFVEGAWEKSKKEVTSSKITRADETTHKMLEGDEKSAWYLWGFSTNTACFFDIRDTRSGDVASEYLKSSNCEYLMTDVFSGYKKAVRESNTYRKEHKLPPIVSIYCNAHARRRFKESKHKFPEESEFFIKKYQIIYKLEKIMNKVPPDKKLRVRQMMKYYFKKMEKKTIDLQFSYSSKSSFGKAMSYFYKNYNEFTLFLTNPQLPIDNNGQERLFRSPVVGRKTWYGTHSKRGARTMAILFSLVESCKLNKINPREYFKDLVQDIHAGIEHYTPFEYKSNKIQSKTLSDLGKSA